MPVVLKLLFAHDEKGVPLFPPDEISAEVRVERNEHPESIDQLRTFFCGCVKPEKYWEAFHAELKRVAMGVPIREEDITPTWVVLSSVLGYFGLVKHSKSTADTLTPSGADALEWLDSQERDNPDFWKEFLKWSMHIERVAKIKTEDILRVTNPTPDPKSSPAPDLDLKLGEPEIPPASPDYTSAPPSVQGDPVDSPDSPG